jgi:hypothetical protein
MTDTIDKPVVTPDALTDALAALGDTPDAVAESLRTKRIVGTRVSRSCPIAEYVRTVLDVPQGARVVAYADNITIRFAPHVRRDGHPWFIDNAASILAHVSTPPAVRDFIDRFDGLEGQPPMYTDLYVKGF